MIGRSPISGSFLQGPFVRSISLRKLASNVTTLEETVRVSICVNYLKGGVEQSRSRKETTRGGCGLYGRFILITRFLNERMCNLLTSLAGLVQHAAFAEICLSCNNVSCFNISNAFDTARIQAGITETEVRHVCITHYLSLFHYTCVFLTFTILLHPDYA